MSQTGLPHSRILRNPRLYTASEMMPKMKSQTMIVSSLSLSQMACSPETAKYEPCVEYHDRRNDASNDMPHRIFSELTFAQYNAIVGNCKCDNNQVVAT